MRHRRKSEYELHRPDHAARRVKFAVHKTPLRPGTDHERDGPVRIDMIRPVLRVVLNDEYGRGPPVPAVRNPVNDHAESPVVLCHERTRRPLSGARTLGVIVRKLDRLKCRKKSVRFVRGELLFPVPVTVDV